MSNMSSTSQNQSAVELLESSTTTMSSDQQVLATSTTTSSTKTTTKKVVKKKKTIATALSTETMVVGAGEESLLEALASSSSIKTTTNGHVQHQESIEECQVNGGSTTAKVKKIVKKKATSSSSTTSSTLTTSTSKEGADLMVESVATVHQDDQYQADQQSADAVKPLKKKTKKTKKSDAEKENISVKSSFSKFDALQKKNILHVRSSDAGKAQEKFNGVAAEPEKNCRACHKPVFKMEEVKAERNIWHRTCFKCTECAKQLNVDTYESHESILYCKPHFRTLFTPKAVEETEPVKPRKHELIIRENQPMELPPDVVRSCDKTDLGLEELHQLNVKSRFQVFEHGQHETTTTTTTTSAEDLRAKGVKRSASILSKLAKFQSRDPNADGPSDAEEEAPEDDESDIECEEGEDIDLIRAKRAQRERPLSFANMSEVKSRFESGAELTKEERREERKQELQNIRSRLFMGKQAKIKEMYQQAVLESEQGVRAVDRKADAVMADMGDKARSIKDRFEKGQVYRGEEDDGDVNAPAPHQVEEDAAVFEQGLGKQSRSLFMEMDANAARTPTNHTQPQTPTPRSREPRTRLPQVSTQMSPKILQSQSFFEDVVKAADRTEDVRIETADISNKFKFFEMYKPTSGEKKQFRITPPREGVVKLPSPDRDDADVASDVYYDPDVVRGGGGDEQQQQAMLQNSHTTTKMLSMFRQMEDARDTQQAYDGLKPLKRFTPPPDNNRRLRTGNSESENDCTDSEEEEEMDEEEEEELQQQHAENGQYVRASDKNVDEFLLQAQSAARAKQLRAKFERWESKEIMREKDASSVLLYGEPGDDQSQVESAKEIRAKFESMRNQPAFAEVREKIKVNRFL